MCILYLLYECTQSSVLPVFINTASPKLSKDNPQEQHMLSHNLILS